ncbi:carbohydrate sulfotransferase 11-like [Patiria miniata]|uniref:Carbohydrate sulfotransferase n=1 Tax=Patiria miniata TaxID=46514 RepID=A0A913ZWA7_PATMI|nr:carbohydrate sulfotransferase 11-like [Patiria miniata]
MAVRICTRLSRSKLVVFILLLAVAVVGTVGLMYTMHAPSGVDFSKVKVDRVPIRAPGPDFLRLEDDWWDGLQKNALFKKTKTIDSVNRSRSESSEIEEDTEEMSFAVAKTWKRATKMPNPDTKTDAVSLDIMASTSRNQVQTSKTLANESCDKTCRWWREQERRQRRVQETCADALHKRTQPVVHYYLTSQTLRTMTHLLVLDSHKLIYCYVPKVSCTNWKRIFLVAKGIFPSVQDIEQRRTHLATDALMRTLSSYPLQTANRLLKEYKKFMFVRHPFERILSAYIDKFQLDYPSSKHFRETSAVEIARYGDLSKTSRLKDGTLNITFQQFSRFVSDPINQNLEPHWQEMYRQCQPCMIQYDFIGNYSSLKEDADFIIKTTKLNQPFPESTNPTGSSKQSKIKRYFSQLTEDEIDALYQRYSTDFHLFGYSVPPYISNRTFS